MHLSKLKELTYKLLPEWNIFQQGTDLIISGGADARYEIELESDELSFFSALKPDSPFTRNQLKKQDDDVLEELITAEIVVPILQKSTTLRVSVIGDGNKLGINYHHDAKTADILLIVRTNSTYIKLLDKIDYKSIVKPHIFVDMAFHHTISFGPLVFPGETACIACLQGRISTRWGDEAPPTSPKAIKDYLGITLELTKIELGKISQNDTSLTNKTISWNFQDRTIKVNQLLKVPICPVCNPNKVSPSGALILPWSKNESITNTI